MTFRSLLFAAFAVLSGPSFAQTPEIDTDRARLQTLAGEDRDMGRMIDGFARNLQREGGDFSEMLRGMTGARLEDGQPFPYRDYMRVEQAQRRAQAMMSILSGDLDGDGALTREEVATTLRLRPRQSELAELFLTGDTDADGTLSPQEIEAVAATVDPRRGRPEIETIGKIADFDDDGLVTDAEILRLQAALQGWDRRGGALTIDPAAPLRRRLTQGTAVCSAVKPSAKAEILVVSGYEGHALSTVTVDGQDGVTSTADLVIEPGDTPLYILVGSYEPLIWRLSGAVDRVERLVAHSGSSTQAGPGVGVTGLPADKVSFEPAGGCIAAKWDGEDSQRGLDHKAAILIHFGRQATAIATPYTLASVALPSARIKDQRRGEVDIVVRNGKRYALTEEGPVEVETPRDGDELTATERDLARFHPGGVVTIDPKTVVAAAPAEPYGILPQQAGLVQLIKAGLIQRRDNAFLILQPIPRFPAGLYGAHSVQFILGPDLPMPPGDPGHSSVRDETRRCLVRMCR